MSLSYTMSMNSTQSAQDAFQAVAALPGFEAVAEDMAVAPGMSAHVTAADEEDKEYGLEEEGFEPTLDIQFVEKRRGVGGEVAMANIVRAVVALLHHADGEAVLRYNYETLLLRLHAGELVLNREPQFWEWYPGLLSLVTLPYRLGPLAS